MEGNEPLSIMAVIDPLNLKAPNSHPRSYMYHEIDIVF